MPERWFAGDTWSFFRELSRAAPGLGAVWWSLLWLRGLLPAGFAVAIGALVGAVERADSVTLPLIATALVFTLVQTLGPLHQAVSSNLGNRLANALYDRITRTCVNPPGIGHLEDPELRQDLTAARDFDLGLNCPPLYIAMDFIASGLVELVSGLASALVLFAYAWWAPPVLALGWLSTHWLLRESAVYRDRNTPEVRAASQHADYAFRLAVDAMAAKELRLFGLAEWIVDGFRAHRRRLFELRWEATRLRERSLVTSILVVLAANGLVFGNLAHDLILEALPLDQAVTFATAAVGAALIAFGGLSWALDGASAPVGAALRLGPAMRAAGALARSGEVTPVRGVASISVNPVEAPAIHVAQLAATAPSRAHEIRFESVTFTYPRTREPVLKNFSLHIPAGSSLAIVGQNGAGKTTLAKLLCRLYDPQEGAIWIDDSPLESLDIDEWRSQLTAVFQDFLRLELPLRDNVAPLGAPDLQIEAALRAAGAAEHVSLETVLARGYVNGTELSGGQWQRVALARSLCAVTRGAGVVLLDEPTAQLDVRGEYEIFGRLLAATRQATTLLISHRFSTVRQVDRICVLEHGCVTELGSHDELMQLGGRYRTMFELQAQRFDAEPEGPPLASSIEGEA